MTHASKPHERLRRLPGRVDACYLGVVPACAGHRI